MLTILHRTTRVMTLGSVENSVNLASKMGNPSESLNALFLNTANKGSTSTGTPAMRTGTTWKSGSSLYLRNTATISGASGSSGSAGSAGGQGAGGGGGAGGNANTTSAGTPGSSGGTGGTGGNGGPGGSGGPCFTADIASGVRILVDNASATLNGGSGGPSGGGGPGGPGGGGGGGGGGVHS